MRRAVTAALLLLACAAACAQVTLIRKIPDSGENQVEAQWSKPRPQPEQTVGQTEFSMRLILGAQAGGNAAREPLADVYSDSTLSLAQPLGNAASLNVAASALRKRRLDGKEQSYSAAVDIAAQKWSLNLNGSYGDRTQIVSEAGGLSTADVDKEDAELLITSTLNAGFIPNLPMSLSYRHDLMRQSETTSGTMESLEDTTSDSLDFMAAGTLGRFGLELDGSLEHSVDGITEVETLSSSGSLSVNIPVLPFLHLRPVLAPVFTKSEQIDGDYTLSTSLAGDLGLYFPLSEALELRLVAGLANTWSSERVSGVVSEDPSQAIWLGESGLEWQPEAGPFASLQYSLAAIYQTGAEPNHSHRGTVSAGWRNPGEQSGLRTLEAGSDFSIQLDESGALDSAESHWNAAADFQPGENLTVDAAYTGSITKSESPAVWTHQLEGGLSHAPDPLLSYQLAATVADASVDQIHTLQADGLAQVTLSPVWNLKAYSITVGENLFYSRELPGQAEQDFLAKTFSSVAVPLGSAVKLRYEFSWEWINRISEGGPPGSAFLHLTGLTLSGVRLPFSLSTDYQIGHGYRGVRHDLTAGLDVPFKKGFGLKAEASVSHYREEDVPVSPYLIGVHGVYEY